jgi:hypothetical protein
VRSTEASCDLNSQQLAPDRDRDVFNTKEAQTMASCQLLHGQRAVACSESGREALIAVVQPTDLRNGDQHQAGDGPGDDMFGANSRYDGFGVGGFYNYGYGNTAPGSDSVNTPLKSSDAHFTRIAALMHYAAENWNVLGEFDYGNNACTLSNMLTGSAPLDAFGSATGTTASCKKFPNADGGQFTSGTHFGRACSKTTPCYGLLNTYEPQTAIYQAILNNGRSRQLGFDFLGHYHIPGTKLTAFGMFQWFMPNDNIRENPLDFQRFVAGISYQYNEYLRFALDSRNLLYYHHHQFGIPVSQAKTFNYVPGSKLNGGILPGNTSVAKSLNTIIPNLVPRDIHSVFLNMEFSY